MSEFKKTLVLDFDGVCHQYTSGWRGAHVIPDPPVEGLFEFLELVAPHFEINIFSSRSNQEGGIEAMQKWFDAYIQQYCEWHNKSWDIALKFPLEKPAAFISIDDRALLFAGVWPDLSTLLEFTPWNKK